MEPLASTYHYIAKRVQVSQIGVVLKIYNLERTIPGETVPGEDMFTNKNKSYQIVHMKMVAHI